jgi:hypothetical protein
MLRGLVESRFGPLVLLQLLAALSPKSNSKSDHDRTHREDLQGCLVHIADI